MPGNLEVWDLWQSAATQWRASGFGLVGLDYPAVLSVARIMGVTIGDVELQKLQVLESAVLASQIEATKSSDSSTRGKAHGYR